MSRKGKTPRKGSALARPIDISYRSNRAALALGAATGVATGAVLLFTGDFEVARPFWTGVAAFLGWAIARELAPDHPGVAAAAIPLTGLLTVWGEAFVGLGVLALLSARVWAGTVGLHPSLLDFAAGGMIAAYVGTDQALWLPGVAFAGGVVSLARHKGEAVLAVAVMAAIAAGVAGVTDADGSVDFSSVELAVVAGLIGVVVAIQPLPGVASLTDQRSLSIPPWRVSAGWVAALVSVASAAMYAGIEQGAPVLAAMVASAPVHLRAKLGRLRGERAQR